MPEQEDAPGSGSARVPFRASVLTLYPEMFPGVLGQSLAGKALQDGTWMLETTQIRDFAMDRHRSVDDTPAGGGAGMVMRADVLARAIDHVSPPGDGRPRLLMSPRGRPLTQARVRELATGPGVTILCGRFEGVDQRVIEARSLEEVSIGDYILSGGEPAALVLLDAVVRLLPGVMGNDASGEEESFENGLLEHPHYTRPQLFEGQAIPEVLISGNHAKIAAWRREKALELTRERRPDLLEARDRAESGRSGHEKSGPAGDKCPATVYERGRTGGESSGPVNE
jgi:tRNA (guanine37-N1)-methyltransferase